MQLYRGDSKGAFRSAQKASAYDTADRLSVNADKLRFRGLWKEGDVQVDASLSVAASSRLHETAAAAACELKKIRSATINDSQSD